MNGNNGKAKTKWPLKALRECVVHRSDFIEIDDTTTYRRPRVQLNVRGIVLRDEVSGFDIKTKSQQICRAGDFLVAEIDAKHGGYGLIPQNLNGVIVSSHYFLFELQPERINARFFEWAIRHPNFYVQVVARGSTNYAAIRPHHVLGYEVPLPPLREQERIAAKLDAAADRTGEIRRHLAAQLADAEKVLRACILNRTDTTPTPMRELVAQRPLDTEVKPDENYQFAGVYSFGRGVFRGGEKSGLDFAYTALTRVRAGEFTYPKLMAWEGAFGIVPPECDGCHVSPEFPVFTVDSKRVLPEVLDVYFRAPSVWPAIAGASTGTNARRRRLQPSAFLAWPLPLPPMPVQLRLREIKQRVDALRSAFADTEADLAALERALLTAAFRGEL